MEYAYTLRYDGSSGYIGKTPIYSQALNAARYYARTYGLSVLITHIWKGKTRETVIHPDGSTTYLWDGER